LCSAEKEEYGNLEDAMTGLKIRLDMGACPGETASYGRIGHRSATWKQEFIGKRVTDEDHEKEGSEP